MCVFTYIITKVCPEVIGYNSGLFLGGKPTCLRWQIRIDTERQTSGPKAQHPKPMELWKWNIYKVGPPNVMLVGL